MREVTLEIDGKKVKAEEGTTILEAARCAGIEIPTLCYHRALSPYGGCRICTVEIFRGRRSRLVTSCVYPVEDGLVVKTKSDNVIRDRKMLIELMLAKAPKAKAIQDLAREYGVKETRFKVEDPDNLCILCGMCARVCEERIGVSAINFVGRGVKRDVKTPYQGTVDIDFDVCIACGSCATVCPTGAIKLEDITAKKPAPILSEFEMGLDSRAPIYIPFPQAIPNVATLDRDQCVHFATGKCRICQDVCEAGAIDFDQEDEVIEVEVGTIIVATGYDQFDPSAMSQYGYRKYPNVLTGLEFERLTCAAGPTEGKILLKDGRQPESIALVHCVGSRDQNYHEYCSRVCCMYALKYAHLARELADADVYQFYIDMRCFGEGYEEFYKRCSEEGVNFIRGKVAKVTEVAITDEEKGKLIVVSEDTLLGKMVRVPVDMVVLCSALEARSDAEDVAKLLTINRRADGFFLERHVKLDPVATPSDGVFICGCCEAPRDIPDTVAQAEATAGKALSLISKGTVTLEAAISTVDESICHGCGRCEEICTFSAPKVVEKDGKLVSSINEALCKGCGSCAVVCPTGAVSIRHFTQDEILAQVAALTEAK
ncbi:MAG: 2Fe-2S iron-sulfur cluster-binding protein [Dehalococcoidia bacterium]